MSIGPRPHAVVPLTRPVAAPSFVYDLGTRVTVAEARSFCAAVNGAVAGGEPSLTLDGRHIVHVDAVGLAALLQCTRLAEGRGVPCVVRASAALGRHCLDARLLDELRLVADGDEDGAPHATPPRAAATDFVVARSTRVVLRQAQAADVERFHHWAEDPFVEQMVGSDLLYRHRHLAADEPASIDSLVHDPRALTAVVESSGGVVLGFVRIYDVDLISRFGFVEAVVTESRSGRQGLGVEASRLLVAYAHDAMQLRRVEAKVYAYNVLSINTLRRNGFVQEGILREARLYEGQPWDIYVFSLLEPEMAEQRARGGFPDFRLLEAAS